MALPTTTTATIQVKRIAKTGTPCYVLIYDSDKKIVAFKYGDFNYTTPADNTVVISSTYDEILSEATKAEIKDFPKQKDGEP